MLSDTARDALYDIRDHAIYATEFVAGMDFETFKQDRKTFFAATRALKMAYSDVGCSLLFSIPDITGPTNAA
jgi:hypothetical protein